MTQILRPLLTTLGIAIYLGSALAPTTAHARRGEGGKHGPMKELGLSEDQKAKIKEIRKNGRETKKKLRSELKEAKEKLRTSAQTDASKDQLVALFNSVQEKQQAAAKFGFSQAMEIREVLTAEQRKKAGAMLGKFFKERGHPGKKGPGPDEDDSEE